ncbi:MAG: TetR/AcrR family transcriptional regulator [Reichenbachiella sp.]|uniref:TetR/AcrR family transcriptional regulator n=1 Tax=Reichenbachiella sp. TaxID=2184521 RepID=UPI003298E540
MNRPSTDIRITNSAKKLFWQFGTKKVSIEEICKDAEVSKMTFYRKFSNKTELAKKVLGEFYAQAKVEYRSFMDESSPFEKKMQQLILFEVKNAENMSQALVQDIFGQADQELKDFMEAQQHEVYQDFIRDLKVAQEAGSIRKDIKLEFVLLMLDNLGKQIADKNLLDMYDSVQEANTELINFFLYGLFDPTSKDEK